MEDNRPLALVTACLYAGSDLNLQSDDALSLALDQRAFGPRRLVVYTARDDGQVIGLAHCLRTDPPESGLMCCLDLLDDGADMAIAYSDEPVSTDPPAGLAERFAAAEAAAGQYGVRLLDWIMCDDIYIRSMRCTLEELDEAWDPR